VSRSIGLPHASNGSSRPWSVAAELGQPVGPPVDEVSANHHQLDPGGVGLDHVRPGISLAALEDRQIGRPALREAPSFSSSPAIIAASRVTMSTSCFGVGSRPRLLGDAASRDLDLGEQAGAAAR
jgi:hypothetical protein